MPDCRDQPWETSVLRPSTRLAAGTLVLALPLAAAAGCGVEKRRTIKAEFASATTNLENSKAASFTLRFDDSKGTAGALATKDGSTPKAVVDALLHGSITYVVDPAGDATLKSLQAGASTASLAEQLKKVNVGFVVRDASAVLGEFRLVAGVLYAHVDLTEIGTIAKAAGVKDFDTSLDQAIASAGPQFAKGLTDLRAGKWITLPVARYLDKFQALAKAFTPAFPVSPGAGVDVAALGNKLVAAVRPYVKVTDANDSSTDRVLDVNVQARPALKAALAVLKGAKDLPFASALKGFDPAQVDATVADGTAHGTITLRSGHLSQFTVDLESVRKLDTTPGPGSLAGASVVVDIDDSAAQVQVPADVSSFDVGALLDELLQGFAARAGAAVPLSG